MTTTWQVIKSVDFSSFWSVFNTKLIHLHLQSVHYLVCQC